MNNLQISVIIPTMNRPNSFKQTLNSLLSLNNIPNQIIVIDQSDKKDVQDYYKEIIMNLNNKANIEYYFQGIPSSTRARNLGLTKCIYDIIVFMDDDIEFFNETFFTVQQIMENDKISMIAGLDAKNQNKTEKNSFLGYLFLFKSFRHRNIGHVTISMRGRFPKTISNQCQTRWAMGFFFVVRRSNVEKWSLCFCELFRKYAYAEDLDFSYSYYLKSNDCGLSCVINPNVIVIHNCTKEYRIPTKEMIYMNIFHRVYLNYKYNKSFLGMVAVTWSNIGLMLESIIKKQNPFIWGKAIIDSIRYRKDIKEGNLHYEIFS